MLPSFFGIAVPQVREARPLRERPHYFLHPARRRVRPHDVPADDAREASDLGGGRRGATFAQPY